MTMKSAILPAAFIVGTLFLGSAEGRAAPLTQTTAVQTKPDTAAPAITVLKAGSEPTPSASAPGDLPPGWMAVEIPGPFEGYVLNKDLTKNLDVKPGSAICFAPTTGSGVLAVAAKGDKTEITGLHGRWTQVRLQKNLVGYIRIGSGAVAISDAGPLAPAAPGSLIVLPSGPGKAAADQTGAGADVARSIEGRFVSTRTLLSPRRPYDWQLSDASGERSAYVDISKLMLTAPISNYIDHDVVVFGNVKTVPGGKDIVVQVESLQLK